MVTELSPHIVFDLPNGNRLEIWLRHKVTVEDFDYIKKIMDLSEKAFVEPTRPPDTEYTKPVDGPTPGEESVEEK